MACGGWLVVRPLVSREKVELARHFWRLADFWADFGAHGPAWPFEVDPATLELSADAGDPRSLTSAAQGCSLLRPGLQPPASMLRPLRPRVAASGAQGCSLRPHGGNTGDAGICHRTPLFWPSELFSDGAAAAAARADGDLDAGRPFDFRPALPS